VKTILNKEDDALLPADAIDAVLFLKTYHGGRIQSCCCEICAPRCVRGRKWGIDCNGNSENHGVGKDVVIREARQAGYKLESQYDFVKSDKMDYFLVFCDCAIVYSPAFSIMAARSNARRGNSEILMYS
jgi:hypothetical protein